MLLQTQCCHQFEKEFHFLCDIETGHLQVKGPNVFAGYWRMQEKTNQEFTPDGWFRTGDEAFIEADNFVTIVGRAKDMIIRGGQNIYPAEIEGLLNDHPKVASVAVVGYPDREMGERTCAYVIPKGGQDFSFEEMVEFLKGKKLAMYKLPERLEVVDEFPAVGDSGKVNKETLKKDIAEKVGKNA